jgi:hypothetical protein
MAQDFLTMDALRRLSYGGKLLICSRHWHCSREADEETGKSSTHQHTAPRMIRIASSSPGQRRPFRRCAGGSSRWWTGAQPPLPRRRPDHRIKGHPTQTGYASPAQLAGSPVEQRHQATAGRPHLPAGDLGVRLPRGPPIHQGLRADAVAVSPSGWRGIGIGRRPGGCRGSYGIL